MADVDYTTHCGWCHAELNGRYILWLPVFHFEPESNRYCSTKCVTARREELFHRPKRLGEKWPRFTAEIPPELAMALDATQRRRMRAAGENPSDALRSNMIRTALRLYLNEYAPFGDPPIEGTLEDELPVLEARS